MNSIADKKLEKDAITGNAEAQYRLGGFYYNRETGPPADRGRSRADTAKALKWLRKAAEQGHAEAQCKLGYYYLHDANFGFLAGFFFFIVERNEVEAVKWYRKAAEQNYAKGQNKLGDCYANGRGVELNEVEAVKWYHKAADQGNADAQYSLGCCYRDGQGVTKNLFGVTKNLIEAVKWFRKAADQGLKSAREELSRIERVTKEAKRYRKAAEWNHAWAQFNLGYCYANGQGVPENLVEAAKWYRKAADQGFEGAREELSRIERRMTPDAIAEAQRLSREFQTYPTDEQRVRIKELAQRELAKNLSDLDVAELGSMAGDEDKSALYEYYLTERQRQDNESKSR